MFVDLINCQRRRRENLKLELSLCAGAPASSQLLQEVKEVLGVKTIKASMEMVLRSWSINKIPFSVRTD